MESGYIRESSNTIEVVIVGQPQMPQLLGRRGLQPAGETAVWGVLPHACHIVSNPALLGAQRECTLQSQAG